MKYITGHNFKEVSSYILDEFGFRPNQKIDKSVPIFFVKTDYIHQFFNSQLLPSSKFILITHNSDYSIDINHSQYIEYEHLYKWFAQNVNYKHTKLIPIPIGIANPEWPHGNIEIIDRTISFNYKKNQLMYANFSIHTNPRQREACIKQIKPEFIENNVTFDIYLKKIAQSYFNICPIGNGIDSHRIWESLYLKTVPIAEDTYNIRYLKNKFNLPIILIKDWSDLVQLSLNDKTYNDLIKDFNPNMLNISEFLNEYTNI